MRLQLRIRQRDLRYLLFWDCIGHGHPYPDPKKKSTLKIFTKCNPAVALMKVEVGMDLLVPTFKNKLKRISNDLLKIQYILHNQI